MKLKSTQQPVKHAGIIKMHQGHTYHGVFIPTRRKSGAQHHLQFVREDNLLQEDS